MQTRIDELEDVVRECEDNAVIQRALFKIADLANSGEDMQTFYKSTHEIFVELTAAENLFIALFDEPNDRVTFPYYVDGDVKEFPVESVTLEEVKIGAVTSLILETRKLVHVCQAEIIEFKKRRGIEELIVATLPQDWLGVPLFQGDLMLGALVIQNYEPGFRYSQQDEELMTFIGHHVATALQRKNFTESLKQAHDEIQESAQELADANEQLKQQMVEREQTNRRLIDLSHQAGKAEIATGVLHNVGNVLNSINVAAAMVEEEIRASRITSLKKATTLLLKQDDLAEFMVNTPQGQKIPSYLDQLADKLIGEQQAALTELEALCEHLNHVKTIVTMQQSYAGISGLKQAVSVPELIEDAEVLLASSMTKHGIQVTKDYEDLPELMLEKQKILQVFVNLLKNAKDALVEGRTDGRQLKIRIKKTATDMLAIEVEDNGVGIAPDNLTDIFTHGFTTKEDGHGFGLHSCANAAREMGGQLLVDSPGLGQGATFTMELPFEPANTPV